MANTEAVGFFEKNNFVSQKFLCFSYILARKLNY